MRARLWRWWGRLKALDDKIESLEFAIVILAGVMALLLRTYPDHHAGSQTVDALFALCPRDWWVLGLTLTCLIGAFGYLDDRTTLRRASAAVSSLFWFITGVYLTSLFPAFILPYLQMVVGFFASFVCTRIAEIKIQSVYRSGQRPPALWWLVGPWAARRWEEWTRRGQPQSKS